MKKKLFALGLIFAIFAATIYYFSANNELSAMKDIKTALEREGYSVQVIQTEKKILLGDCYRLILNEDKDFTVTVYVYETVQKARDDAQTIDENGFIIEKSGILGTTNSYCISWVDAPHFFLYKNVIVQYIGMNYDLLQCLYQLCGSQIAGQPFIDSPLIETVQYFPGNDKKSCSYPLRVEKSVDNC